MKTGLLKVLLAAGERCHLFDHRFYRDLFSIFLVKCEEDGIITEAAYEKLKRELENCAQHSHNQTYLPDFSAYVSELTFDHTACYTVKNEIPNLLAFA